MRAAAAAAAAGLLLLLCLAGAARAHGGHDHGEEYSTKAVGDEASTIEALMTPGSEDFCPGVGEGLMGGWQEVDLTPETIPVELQSYWNETFAEYLMNDYLMEPNATWVPCDTPESTQVGCSQVVAGTNYQIRAALTCEAEGSENTVVVQMDTFWPLPGSNEEPTNDFSIVYQPPAKEA